MSRVVQVNNQKILLPEDENNQDKFIGLWLKAQSKAITKVKDEFIFKDYTTNEIDEKIDEYTLKIYRQLRYGGNNVYRRELET
tara:strand:+ start:1093 stop:1341 length:249 start_codon:yes stop_codon:yes gene_type:complete